MDKFKIQPGQKIDLKKMDPGDKSFFNGDKKDGKKELIRLNGELEMMQEMLYAENKHKLLVILQGTDTSGKDGVVRHVFEGVNPQGVSVASFKVPTEKELSHDYLWRIHKQMPGSGEIVIFNRSHYEDVLVVRVHSLVPEAVWKKRYEQINNFEKMLKEEGTIILKFFLFIDKNEQAERLKARLDDPTKQWKFNPADLKERESWDSYQKAYNDMLEKTSTEWAPWYIIPSNRKWYRNLVIANIMVETLKKLDIEYPQPEVSLDNIKID